MKHTKYTVAVMLMTTTLVAQVAAADVVQAEKDPPFQAEAQLGAIITSGNTDSTALKGKLQIKQNLRKWRTDYVLEALFKEDEVDYELDGETLTEEQVTAEKYFASVQADYKLNKQRRGLFVFGSYEDDRFSGYSYQATLAAGYTDVIFETDASLLTYSIGPGYTFYETEDTTDADGDLVAGESDSSLIVRLAGAFIHSFSEHAEFSQKLSIDYATDSDKNTKTRSETALTTKINDDFAFKASFTVTNNSEVPEGIEDTDSETALTLVYSF